MSGLKRGDRVRLNVEAEVSSYDARTLGIKVDGDVIGFLMTRKAEHLFEKIEPPVTVFKPGDFVLPNDGDGDVKDEVVALGTEGFIEGGGRYYRYDDPRAGMPLNHFNSKNYTKVTLG